MGPKPAERRSRLPLRLAIALALSTVAGVVVVAVAASSDDDHALRPTTTGTTADSATSEPSEEPAPEGEQRPFVEITPLQGRPAAVTFGAGALWVADDREGRIVVLDAESGAFLSDAVAVGPSPVALAHHEGILWVADASGTVHRVDTTRRDPSVVAVAVGGTPVDVVAGPDGVFVLDIARSYVHRLDAASGEIVASAKVPAGVVRSATDGDELWVTNLGRSVTPLSLPDLTVGRAVDVGDGPIGVAVAQGRVWVANSDDDTVTVIDATTHEVLEPGLAVGGAPINVVPDGDVVWVVSQDSQEAVPLSARTGRRDDEPFGLGGRPRGAAASPAGLWVAAVDPSAAILVPRS